MAIEVLVKYKDSQRKWTLIPISSQAAFTNYWIPACKELGLSQLLEIENGGDLNLDKVASIINELIKLLTYVNGVDNLPLSIGDRALLKKRIENLISAFLELKNNWNDISEAYI